MSAMYANVLVRWRILCVHLYYFDNLRSVRNLIRAPLGASNPEGVMGEGVRSMRSSEGCAIAQAVARGPPS